MKLSTILGVLLTALAPIAHATVTISVNADMLNGTAGTGSPAPVDALVALIADTDNAGVAVRQGPLAVGGFMDNAPGAIFNTDLILGLQTFNDVTGTAGAFYYSWNLSFNGNWGENDNLYLAWFPTYTNSTVASVGSDYYGIIPLGLTPADGVATQFDYVTSDASFWNLPGSDPVTIANLQVQPVPEPSSFFVLAGLGVMGLLRRRVRRPAN